jgi:hypothetical protein
MGGEDGQVKIRDDSIRTPRFNEGRHSTSMNHPRRTWGTRLCLVSLQMLIHDNLLTGPNSFFFSEAYLTVHEYFSRTYSF